MKRAILSPKAQEDLDEIWLYIARDSPAAATRFIERLCAKCNFIEGSPGIGRQRAELAPDLRSFPTGKYLIFYRIAKRGIEVARILHGHRNIEAEFNA